MGNATTNQIEETKSQERKNKNKCVEQIFAERDAIHYLKGLTLNINFHVALIVPMK